MHRSPAEAALDELEEAAKLWLLCQPLPAPLDAEQLDALRQHFGASW